MEMAKRRERERRQRGNFSLRQSSALFYQHVFRGRRSSENKRKQFEAMTAVNSLEYENILYTYLRFYITTILKFPYQLFYSLC